MTTGAGDPFGLTPQQRHASDIAAALDAFVDTYGPRIEHAVDGAWFVRDGGRIITAAHWVAGWRP